MPAQAGTEDIQRLAMSIQFAADQDAMRRTPPFLASTRVGSRLAWRGMAGMEDAACVIGTQVDAELRKYARRSQAGDAVRTGPAGRCACVPWNPPTW
jgi:hypothetical protein